MKLQNLIATMAVASCSIPSLSAYAQTGAPEFFGNINAGVQKVDGETDIDGQAFEISLGARGLYKKEDFTMLYNLEAEFTEATNNDKGKSDIEIKTANLIFPTKYGVFVLEPRGENQVQKDMFKAIDIFENNEANDSTLWGQPDEGSSVFAYDSPTFNNITVKASVLTLNSSNTPNTNSNDQDADAFTVRAIYENDGLLLGLANVSVSQEQTGSDDRFNTVIFTAGYELGNTKLGLTWESQSDHPAPFDSDSDIVGVAADIDLGDGWSLGLGYTDKNSEQDAADDSAALLIVRKQVLDNVYFYAEGADYSENTVADNVSFGVDVKF